MQNSEVCINEHYVIKIFIEIKYVFQKKLFFY